MSRVVTLAISGRTGEIPACARYDCGWHIGKEPTVCYLIDRSIQQSRYQDFESDYDEPLRRAMDARLSPGGIFYDVQVDLYGQGDVSPIDLDSYRSFEGFRLETASGARSEHSRICLVRKLER